MSYKSFHAIFIAHLKILVHVRAALLLVDKYNDLLRFWNLLYTLNAGWGGIVFAHAIALKRPLNMHRLLSDWLERKLD